MTNCQECGYTTSEDIRYCEKCGAEIENIVDKFTNKYNRLFPVEVEDYKIEEINRWIDKQYDRCSTKEPQCTVSDLNHLALSLGTSKRVIRKARGKRKKTLEELNEDIQDVWDKDLPNYALRKVRKR